MTSREDLEDYGKHRKNIVMLLTLRDTLQRAIF